MWTKEAPTKTETYWFYGHIDAGWWFNNTPQEKALYHVTLYRSGWEKSIVYWAEEINHNHHAETYDLSLFNGMWHDEIVPELP